MVAKLTRPKLKALSGIFANFSEVFLASIVIPVFFAKLDANKVFVLLSGLALTLASMLLSLTFAQKGRI